MVKLIKLIARSYSVGDLACLPYSEGERKEMKKVCVCGGRVEGGGDGGGGEETGVFHLMFVLFQPSVVRLIKCVLIEEWHLNL